MEGRDEEGQKGRRKETKDGGRREGRKEGKKEGRGKRAKDGKTETKKKTDKRAQKRPVFCWRTQSARGFFTPFGKADPNYPRPSPRHFSRFLLANSDRAGRLTG